MNRRETIRRILSRTSMEELKSVIEEEIPGFTAACERVRDIGPTSAIVIRFSDFDESDEDNLFLGTLAKYARSVGVVNVIISGNSCSEDKVGKLVSTRFLSTDPVLA